MHNRTQEAVSVIWTRAAAMLLATFNSSQEQDPNHHMRCAAQYEALIHKFMMLAADAARTEAANG